MSKRTDAERQEALDELRAMFPAGSTVPTILRHVSSSGMSRAVSVIGPNLGDVSYLVARAGVAKLDPRHQGLKMGGCGMDMGFALVYGLARTLYADGFKCVGKGCPSNDHSNDYGTFTRSYDEQHDPDHDSAYSADYDARCAYVAARQDAFKATERRRYSKRRQHSDPGYALSHRWI